MYIMRQELVDRVTELVGSSATSDDVLVRAEIARAYDDLRYTSSRLRPSASIVPRDEHAAPVDEETLVILAARRVLTLSGTKMASPEERGIQETRIGASTRAYARFSFASRVELPRENGASESREGM
jgi:hypothetical protein